MPDTADLCFMPGLAAAAAGCPPSLAHHDAPAAATPAHAEHTPFAWQIAKGLAVKPAANLGHHSLRNPGRFKTSLANRPQSADLPAPVTKAPQPRCRSADHQAERMPCGIPVDAPGNLLAAGTRPRGDVLAGERRARCDNSVMSGSQISYQDVEVHEAA